MNLTNALIFLSIQLGVAYTADRLWDRWTNRPTEWVVRFDRAARDRVRNADLDRMKIR